MKEGRVRDEKNVKGQVTIFVILALVIVVVGIALYFFYPKVISNSNSLEENPKTYMQNCVEGVLQENVDTVSSQGGSINPPSSFFYNGTNVEYLCYTNQPYEKCVVQRVLLISHIEEELQNSTRKKLNDCFDSMNSDYSSKGYETSLKRGEFNVILLPKQILLHSNTTFSITKGSTQKYESFDIVLNNNLYELASIARVIVNWEKTYGDSDPTYFMNFYRDLKIEKMPQSDGTRIYIITDRNTKSKFQFASRSVVWPLGVTFQPI